MLQLPAGTGLLQLDKNGYFLSDHPAIRLTIIQTFGGSGQSDTGTNFAPHDVKVMAYDLILGGKVYTVIYSVRPPEQFTTYLQTAQSMIDSSQIISKQ